MKTPATALVRRIPWVLVVFLAALTIPWIGSRYDTFLATQIAISALFAVSLNLLLGTTGLVSFGHVAYFGIGSYVCGILMKTYAMPFSIALPAAALGAAFGALIFGFFCVRLTKIYFAMLTLAFAQIVFAVVHQWDAVTGGDNGILSVWPPPWLKSPVRYYYWALVFAGAGVVLLRLVAASPFGLTLRAVRDHARRAEAVGINIRALQWTAFVVAGFFAGLAGAVFAFLKGSVFPVYTESPMSVQPLVMVLLGGIGAPSGPLIGAAAYKLLDTVITRYTEYWQIWLGGILIALILAFPRGIAGVLDWRRS
jgi:ABC-type branched-subunit amino acid transport system permease subunit